MEPPPAETAPAINLAPAPRADFDPARAGRGRLADIPTWTLEVLTVEDVSPSMRLVRFTGAGLDTLRHRAGQDLMITFPGERPTRRRYTIRRADPDQGTVDVCFALHGTGPATRWAEQAAVGQELEALGPRGNVTIVDGLDWHLLLGDDSAVPAVLAMLEDLPSGTTGIAFLEVDAPADEQPFVAPDGASVDLRWLHRSGRSPGRTSLLRDALAAVDLRGGRGHVYLAGEVSAVWLMRADLLARGFGADIVDPKGYWSLGKGNLGHGEPERPPS